jgi:hypothetical protein
MILMAESKIMGNLLPVSSSVKVGDKCLLPAKRTIGWRKAMN